MSTHPLIDATEVLTNPDPDLDTAAFEALTLSEVSDNRIWDEQAVVREIQHHLNETAHHFIEIGKRLIWAKNVMGGEKMREWANLHFRISAHSAYRFMSVATLALRHPAIERSMATAGVKKAMLLTTLDDSQVELIINEGRLGDEDLSKLADIPFDTLAKEVKKLRFENGRLTNTNEKMTRRIAELSGLESTNDESAMRKLQELRKSFDETMGTVGIQIERMIQERAKLGPSAQSHLAGFVAYTRARVQLEELRWRTVLGAAETPVGMEWEELLATPRPKDNVYTLPTGRIPSAVE